MPPHSLTSPRVGNFGWRSCENVRRKSQMFEREVAQKAMKFPRKQACLTDGPTKTEFWKVYVICNTRVYLTVHTFVCGLLFPLHVTLATWFSSTWLSLFVQLIRMWFPFDLIKTSFKITWLFLFAQVVKAAVCSHLSWIVLWGSVLGAIVGCLAELASVYVKGTWLVEQRNVSHLESGSVPLRGIIMEGALLETPLFSLANRPGDLCIETKCLF